MEPVAASGFLTTTFMSAAEELDDFDSVVRLHWPAVFRFALASLRDRDAAQTLTQDCFVHAWRGRGTFRGASSVKTWILRIAVNLVRDRARNRRLQFWKRTTARALDIQTAGEHIADGQLSSEGKVLERVRAVWEVSRMLPQRQRTALLLRFVEDMDLLEIAAAMGLKEGTVKVHLFRAVQAVRPAALRQRHPLDHAGIEFLPGVLEQALLRKRVLGIEDQDFRARLLGLQIMRYQAGALVRRGRTARRARGHREHNEAAVVHGLQLSA